MALTRLWCTSWYSPHARALSAANASIYPSPPTQSWLQSRLQHAFGDPPTASSLKHSTASIVPEHSKAIERGAFVSIASLQGLHLRPRLRCPVSIISLELSTI